MCRPAHNMYIMCIRCPVFFLFFEYFWNVAFKFNPLFFYLSGKASCTMNADLFIKKFPLTYSHISKSAENVEIITTKSPMCVFAQKMHYVYFCPISFKLNYFIRCPKIISFYLYINQNLICKHRISIEKRTLNYTFIKTQKCSTIISSKGYRLDD